MARGTRQSGDEELGRYVSARKKRGLGRPKIQPPLVPMIDVTFQLLLYFLLTAEFRMAEGQVAGAVPAKGEVAARSVVEPDPIRVVIRGGWQDGPTVSYEVGGVRARSAEELYGRLMGRRRMVGADVPVVIQPLAEVPWQYVIEAFNQAVRAKFGKVGFASGG